MNRSISPVTGNTPPFVAERPLNSAALKRPEIEDSPFSVLRKAYLLSSLEADEVVQVPGAFLKALLNIAAAQVRVDENWYLSTYPDVQEAISKGKFKNAKHHYVEFGYFEDRLPYPIKVDEEYYRQRNPDIAKAVDAGKIESLKGHFERHGFKEGRLPYDGWRLLENA